MTVEKISSSISKKEWCQTGAAKPQLPNHQSHKSTNGLENERKNLDVFIYSKKMFPQRGEKHFKFEQKFVLMVVAKQREMFGW